MKVEPIRVLINIFPYLLFTSVLAGILIAVMINRYDLLSTGAIIAAPILISSIWILFHNQDVKKKAEINNINIIKVLHPHLLFLLFYLIAIIILLNNTERSFYYFFIITVLYFIIFIQIMFQMERQLIVLLEIILLMLNLIFGVTFKYGLYFGGSDTLVHMYFCEVVSITGHILPLSLEAAYAYFPLFHVLISISQSLLGISLKESFFLTTAIIFVIGILPIYYIIWMISENKKLALLSCMLYSSFPTVVYYGLYVSPRVAAYIELIFLLYILIRVSKAPNPALSKLLAIFIVITIILVHSVSILQFLVIIFLIGFAERLLGAKKRVSGKFYLLLLIMFIAYWFFVAVMLTSNIITFFFNPIHFENIATTPMAVDILRFTADNFPYIIFLFIGLIGIDRSLRKGDFCAVFALVSAPLLLFFIPNPLKGVWILQQHFGFYRFELFVTPFMAFIGGVGVYVVFMHLYGMKSSRVKSLYSIFAIFLFLSCIFTSIYNSSNASDVQMGVPSRYFSSAELLLFGFIEKKVPMNSTIHGDYSSERYFAGRKYFPGIEFYGMNSYKSMILQSLNEVNKAHGYFVYRISELHKKDRLVFYTSSNVLEVRNRSESIKKIEADLNQRHLIYGSDSGEIFYNPSSI